MGRKTVLFGFPVLRSLTRSGLQGKSPKKPYPSHLLTAKKQKGLIQNLLRLFPTDGG